MKIVEPLFCTEFVSLDCDKVHKDGNFCITSNQVEKSCMSAEKAKSNEKYTDYNESEYKYPDIDKLLYNNSYLNSTYAAESINKTLFKFTANQNNVECEPTVNPISMEPRISNIEVDSKLSLEDVLPDSDPIHTYNNLLLTEKEIEELCTSSDNSESSDDLNDTLELLDYILNNKYKDVNREQISDKSIDLNLPVTTESFDETHVESSPNKNITTLNDDNCLLSKEIKPKVSTIKTLSCLASEAISVNYHMAHTDDGFHTSNKEVEELCLSPEPTDSSDKLSETLESVEYILSKSGTCISVYICNTSIQDMKESDCNFTTPLLGSKQSTPKTLISISIKKPSHVNSSLSTYIQNSHHVPMLRDVHKKKPSAASTSELV